MLSEALTLAWAPDESKCDRRLPVNFDLSIELICQQTSTNSNRFPPSVRWMLELSPNFTLDSLGVVSPEHNHQQVSFYGGFRLIDI